jgi:hypothetical protein
VRLPVVGDRLYEWALPRKNSLTGAGLLMEVADSLGGKWTDRRLS